MKKSLKKKKSLDCGRKGRIWITVIFHFVGLVFLGLRSREGRTDEIQISDVHLIGRKNGEKGESGTDGLRKQKGEKEPVSHRRGWRRGGWRKKLSCLVICETKKRGRKKQRRMVDKWWPLSWPKPRERSSKKKVLGCQGRRERNIKTI